MCGTVAFKSPASAFALPMILEYPNFGDRLFMICTISIKMVVPSNDDSLSRKNAALAAST